MKLSILENSFHSLYYAMWLSNCADVEDDGKNKYEDGYIVNNDKIGGQSFYIDSYQKPPNKFINIISLQQEVGSLELLLKAIIQEKIISESIYKKNGKTIGFYDSVTIVNNWLGNIKIFKNELEKIKVLRNCIEHSDFSTNEIEINDMQKSLTSLIYTLVRYSFDINIVEYYQWNSWTEEYDNVGDKIQSLLEGMGKKTNGIENIFLNNDILYGHCLNCSCCSVDAISGVCGICLYEIKPKIVQDIIELDTLSKKNRAHKNKFHNK